MSSDSVDGGSQAGQPLLDLVVSRLEVEPGQVAVLASRQERLVCRVARAEGDLVAKVSTHRGDFEQESRAMRRLAGMGIPVSEVVLVEPGPPAMLVSHWVEGEPISVDSGARASGEVGRILRRIHRERAVGPFSGHATIGAWIEHWYGLVIAWWAESGDLEPVTRDIADRWLAEARPVLADRHGRLMLFDGRPEHFLVGPGGRVALIDVADLQAGEAAMDLAVLELDAPGILPAVLDGYEATAEERGAFDVLVPFLVFLRALSGAEWRGRVLGDEAESRRYLAKARALLSERER